MAKNLSLGIDIGSEHIRLAVASFSEHGKKIRAKASVKTKGISRGRIAEMNEFSDSVGRGLTAIAKSFPQEKIWEATVGFSAGMITKSVTISTIVTHGFGEVTQLDLVRGQEKAIAKLKNQNHHLVTSEITSFSLDGKPLDQNPIGMRGKKLELTFLFVLLPRQMINQLEEVFDALDVDISGITATPLIESPLVTSELERTAGVLVMNMGSELTTLTIYEHGRLLETAVIEKGGADATNAIALGLKISLEEAETLKKTPTIANKTVAKKVEAVLNKHYKQLFTETNKILAGIGRKKLLPAGVVFTGSASLYPGIETIAKSELSIPAKKASVRIVKKELDKRELVWAGTYGLAFSGLSTNSSGGLKKIIGGIRKLLRNFFI